MSDTVPGCPLCNAQGGLPVWSDADWRVIRVDDLAFPAFYRLVSQAHVREMSDLPAAARHRCIDLACAIERTVALHLQPTKMNLATLGNVVPHLHWHVVARFDWDSRFPDPIWAAPLREVLPMTASPESRLRLPLAQLDHHVRSALAAVA